MNNEQLLPPPDEPIPPQEYQDWLQRLKQIQTTKHQQPDQTHQTAPYNPPQIPIPPDQTHIPNKTPFNTLQTDRRWYRSPNK